MIFDIVSDYKPQLLNMLEQLLGSVIVQQIYA